jgi:hypothetical protein
MALQGTQMFKNSYNAGYHVHVSNKTTIRSMNFAAKATNFAIKVIYFVVKVIYFAAKVTYFAVKTI